MTRLFLGTFISKADQHRLGGLKQKNERLEDLWRRKIRWVKPEKLHMTWVFLGNVNDDLIEPVTDMLTNLVSKELSKQPDTTGLKIVFDKPEVWPNARKPRQIVLTPSAVDKPVMQLGKTLRTGLLEFYLDQSQMEEGRAFKPHLTLSRLERRQDADSPASGAHKIKVADLEGFDAALPVVLNLRKIALIESETGKNGSYQVLHEVSTAWRR